jgi:hypothetical protein
MPEWGEAEWAKLLDEETGFFHGTIDEAVVQTLSLAITNHKDHRAEVLRTANEVVIDFRGDLPNKYLAMMLGGYKVGVYRSGNNWPIWLSIQPTYDLAVKEAESIAAEAGLPKGKSVSAVGALSNFLKVDLGPPILSSSSVKTDIGGWIVAVVIAAIGLITWLMK